MHDYIKGQKIICAYTTKNNKRIKSNIFLKKCEKFLPTYMTPVQYYFFNKFPITGNQGKINRGEVIQRLKKKHDKNI